MRIRNQSFPEDKGEENKAKEMADTNEHTYFAKNQ